MKILSIDRSKCNGCGVCEVLCSVVKKKAAQPSQARVRLQRIGGLDMQYAITCQHCAEPVCVSACLKRVIDKDINTGVVSRKTDGCFACAACYVQCPMGAVAYDLELDVYVTCDHCGGDPLCVKTCPVGALRYEEETAISSAFRNDYGYRLYHQGFGGKHSD